MFFEKVKVSPVQLMILLMLRRSRMHGYDMIQELEREFHGMWEPKTGTIYPALKSLVKRGFVEFKVVKRAGPDRKAYRLTEDGEEIISKVLEMIEREINLIDKYFDFILSNLFKGERRLFKELK